MKKNGEFKEYRKFRVPEGIEREWSLEIKEKLMDDICAGSNLPQVAQLARVNLPKSEILDAFKLLSTSPLRDRILTTIQQLEPLFAPDMYKSIMRIFE